MADDVGEACNILLCCYIQCSYFVTRMNGEKNKQMFVSLINVGLNTNVLLKISAYIKIELSNTQVKCQSLRLYLPIAVALNSFQVIQIG